MDPVRLAVFLLLLLPLPDREPQEGGAIAWEAGRRLTWADFRGTPPESRRVAATSTSGLRYSLKSDGGGGKPGEYTVEAVFYPNQSWYHRELCDSLVLSHEQLHFDIVELHARKMRQRLARTPFGPNAARQVRRLFREINRELEAFQARYDRETDFSRDREAQARWEAFLAESLGPENKQPGAGTRGNR